jgi:hypothetical protein
MADEPNKSTSWWATLPGIITATAALVTATGGLIAVLYQQGIVGSKVASAAGQSQAKSTPDTTVSAAPNLTPPAATSTPASVTKASNNSSETKPWDTAIATFTMRDGSKISVPSKSFDHEGDKHIVLNNGQAIARELIRTIDVEESSSDKNSVMLRMIVLKGTVIEGDIGGYGQLEGKNEFGKVTPSWINIKRIDFGR